MPVKEFLGDKDEAISYAVLESNRASTQEGLVSDINAVRKMLTDGYNKSEMIKYVKPQSYLENVIRYTHLNPNGKFIEYLSSPSKASFPYLERNASWVGDLRKKYSEKLTDLHESEIFDYIYNSGSSKGLQLSKEQLYNLINSKVMKLDYNNQNPLNLMNIVSTNTIISPARDKINEMKSDVDYWQKEIQKKQDLIVRARLEGNQDLVSKFQTFISDATSRILDIKEKVQKLESELNTVQNSVVHDLFSNVSENSEMAKIEADYVSYEMKKAESEMIGDLKEDVNECNNEIIDFSKKYNKELIQVNSDISINNMPQIVVSIDSEKIKFKQNFGKHNNSSELILTFDELSELFSKGKIEFSNYKTEEFTTFDLMLKIKQICLIKENNLKSAMGMANYSVETISNMSLALKELSESKDAIEAQLNSVEQEKQLLQEQKENQKNYSKVLTKLYGIDFKADEISGKSQPIENESTEVIKKYVEHIKSEVSKMETPFDDYIYMELQDSNYHSLNLVLGLLGFYSSNHYEWVKTHDRYDNIISIVDEILNPKPIEPPKHEISKKEIIEKKLKGLNVAFKYADKDQKVIIEKKIKGLKVALKYTKDDSEQLERGGNVSEYGGDKVGEIVRVEAKRGTFEILSFSDLNSTDENLLPTTKVELKTIKTGKVITVPINKLFFDSSKIVKKEGGTIDAAERDMLKSEYYIKLDVLFNRPIVFNAEIDVIKSTVHKNYGSVRIRTNYQPLKDYLIENDLSGNMKTKLSKEKAREIIESFDFQKSDGIYTAEDFHEDRYLLNTYRHSKEFVKALNLHFD